MPPIALTMGDPAGIGGEITTAAWRALRQSGPAFFLIGDPGWIGHVDPGLPLALIGEPGEAAGRFPSALPVLPLALAKPAVPGQPDAGNAAPVIRSIELATGFALEAAAAAVVTNPIAKSVLYQGGFTHPGHTEFLAALTSAPHPVMMLAAPSLRVVPVTVHISLRQALDRLDAESIVTAGRVTHEALRRDFGLSEPRLAVAGLNPHAGEAGSMGEEEITIINPAIAALQSQGIDAFTFESCC